MLVMDYALNYLLMPLFFNFVGRNMKMVTMKMLVSLSLLKCLLLGMYITTTFD